jgi:D-sedoheptulose 7-phosphate isomerase
MSEYLTHITREIEDSIRVKQGLAQACGDQIIEAARLIQSCLRAGGKLIVFGNGGSAADAQHLAAELVGRYRAERQALAAVAITTDSASMTAIANDYGFEQIFSRQVEALAKPNDLAIAISTSGNSANVLCALEFARMVGIASIGLTGMDGGKLRDLVRVCICVPSNSTPRIQESHALIVHILCGIVENAYVQEQHAKVGAQSSIGEVR